MCQGILRSAGDTTVPFAVTACSYWLVCIPLGYILSGMPLPWDISVSPHLFGVSGWWYVLTVSITLVAVLLYLRVRKSVCHTGAGEISISDINL